MYLDRPLKILCTGRHFWIALNVSSAICPASKNTYRGRIWRLNVPPKLEPQFCKGLGKGTLAGSGSGQVSRTTITDRRFLEMRVQRRAFLSRCCGRAPGGPIPWQAELGVLGSLYQEWTASLPKNNRSWTRMNSDFSFEYPNETKPFNMKRPSSAFGNYQLASSQGNFTLFSRKICGLSLGKSEEATYWLNKTKRLGMLTRKGKRNTHWVIMSFLYIKD